LKPFCLIVDLNKKVSNCYAILQYEFNYDGRALIFWQLPVERLENSLSRGIIYPVILEFMNSNSQLTRNLSKKDF